jgi:hypothetical protein
MKNLIKHIIIIILIANSYFLLNSQKSADSINVKIPDTTSKDKQKLLKNPVGQEFWLCFQRNYKETGNSASDKLYLELFITGDFDAKVKIEIPGIKFKMDTLVPGETVVNVKIPSTAQVLASENNEQLAVHIKSSSPISVYGLNRRFQTTDTYLGLPTEVLGYEYRAMCFDESEGLVSQIAIVATENNTDVSIVPSVNTLKYPKGIEYSVKLQKGDVYQIIPKFEPFSTCDLTGTMIKSKKKIAVFSGHQCSYVPDNVVACNHLVEQMPPLPSWGRHFYLGNFHSRNRYTYRVLAHQNDTKVFENNKLIKTLKAGEYFTKIDKRNLQLTATRPVLVAQYSHGFSDGDSIGDPMMILVSPTQQFLKTYRFATPVNGSWNHFVNLVAPTSSINSLRLNGKMISSSDFKQIGISRYSIGHLKVPFGTHTLTGGDPFGMYSYGFGFKGALKDDAYDAYGTMGGQSFLEYEIEQDSLPPMADLDMSKDTVELIFRDDRVDDSGLREVRVVENYGIEVQIENISPGMPQTAVKLDAIMPEIAGKVIIEAIDVALNKSTYTICYYFDVYSEKFVYTVTEGTDETCEVDPGIQLGGFGNMTANMNFTNFSRTKGVIANGKFSEGFAFGGYTGILIGRHLRPDMIVSARIGLENNPVVIKAPDSLISKVRDTQTGELRDFQEETSISLDAMFMNVSFAYEWYLKNRIYFIGGLCFSLAIDKSIEVKRRILIPEDFLYNNKTKEVIDKSVNELESLNTIRYSFFGGVGFNYNITYRLSLFSETKYQLFLGNMISDGDWSHHQLSLHLGFRYRFFK